MGFSGSTLLDLLLGGHRRFVGIGEVFQLLKPNRYWLERSRDVLCACGRVMEECEFWRPVCDRLRKGDFSTTAQKYKMVLDVFDDVFGKDRVPVDSSKYLHNLKVLHEMPEVDLKVLFLIRDIRGWGLSARKARRRQRQFHLKDLLKVYGSKAAFHWFVRTWFGLFLHWYHSNRRMQRYLRKENIPTFQLGYEELCLYADRIIPKMCEFLGVEPVENMFSPKDSHSHTALGNASRFQTDKRAGLFYNNRWFYETEWLLLAALFRHIMRYNAKEVYSNTHGVLWDKK